MFYRENFYRERKIEIQIKKNWFERQNHVYQLSLDVIVDQIVVFLNFADDNELISLS